MAHEINHQTKRRKTSKTSFPDLSAQGLGEKGHHVSLLEELDECITCIILSFCHGNALHLPVDASGSATDNVKSLLSTMMVSKSFSEGCSTFLRTTPVTLVLSTENLTFPGQRIHDFIPPGMCGWALRHHVRVGKLVIDQSNPRDMTALDLRIILQLLLSFDLSSLQEFTVRINGFVARPTPHERSRAIAKGWSAQIVRETVYSYDFHLGTFVKFLARRMGGDANDNDNADTSCPCPILQKMTLKKPRSVPTQLDKVFLPLIAAASKTLQSLHVEAYPPSQTCTRGVRSLEEILTMVEQMPHLKKLYVDYPLLEDLNLSSNSSPPPLRIKSTSLEEISGNLEGWKLQEYDCPLVNTLSCRIARS